MAQDRFPAGVASLRAAMKPRRTPTAVTYETAATAETSGLALAAMDERRDEERVVRVATGLDFSPLYWLAVQDYTQLLAKIVADASKATQQTPAQTHADQQEQTSFALRLLCARMFVAGCLVCERGGK